MGETAVTLDIFNFRFVRITLVNSNIENLSQLTLIDNSTIKVQMSSRILHECH